MRVGPVPILTDVHLQVDAGEVVGVAGPNGAGKTTLLSVAATFLFPTSGEGRVLGARLGSREVMSVRPRIGWSGHDPGLYPELTLAENLAVVAATAGLDRGAVAEALELVGLAGAADRRADRSSNGMQRRTDLARLLLIRPTLLLLDEAHAGLDADAEVIIDALVHRVVAQGGAGLLVSHDASRLARRVDRLVRIEAGRLLP